MYIIDFAKQILKGKNIPILIYLLVNIFIIALLAMNTFSEGWVQAFALGMIVYLFSLMIALSPIGEFILRIQTGCKKIKRKDYANYIYPLFTEVLMQAREKNPSISENVKLFMIDDEEANAFATGRKTICITKGMLNASEGEIKAVLAHELGHLANKDTDLILVVSVGNFIVTFILVGIRLFAQFISLVFQICGVFAGEALINIGSFLSGLIVDLILVFFMKIWTKIGMLLVMKSSRSHEYAADKFSADLGYGVELCMFLDRFDGYGFSGLFASLVQSHPDSNQRIAKLQAEGVEYYLERA